MVQKLLADVPRRDDGRLQMMLDAVPLVDAMGAMLGGCFLLQQARIAAEQLAALLAEKSVDGSDTEAFRALLAENRRAAYLHNKVQSALCFCYRAVPPGAAQLTAMEAGEQAAVDAVL